MWSSPEYNCELGIADNLFIIAVLNISAVIFSNNCGQIANKIHYVYIKTREEDIMNDLIKYVSRDNEAYEIDPSDPIMICDIGGKVIVEDAMHCNNKEIQDKVEPLVSLFEYADENSRNDIIVRNGSYYESKKIGIYRVIRRIVRLEGQRVVD